MYLASIQRYRRVGADEMRSNGVDLFKSTQNHEEDSRHSENKNNENANLQDIHKQFSILIFLLFHSVLPDGFIRVCRHGGGRGVTCWNRAEIRFRADFSRGNEMATPP